MILLVLAIIFASNSGFLLFCMWKTNFRRCFWPAVVSAVLLFAATIFLGFSYG